MSRLSALPPLHHSSCCRSSLRGLPASVLPAAARTHARARTHAHARTAVRVFLGVTSITSSGVTASERQLWHQYSSLLASSCSPETLLSSQVTAPQRACGQKQMNVD